MLIGHSGRTRVEELILAMVLLIIAVRAAIPTPNNTIYGFYWVKAIFAVLIAAPAVWLIAARTLEHRKHALLAAVITYTYCGALPVVRDWSLFGFGAGLIGLGGGFSIYLYYLTREEITWIQQQSSPSQPQGPGPPGMSSSE
jgi:uncharacterized membrane protein YfcA